VVVEKEEVDRKVKEEKLVFFIVALVLLTIVI
jgi:hypothetical protein